MSQSLKAFVMCGAPGSGKSTYVAKIVQDLQDAVVTGGDIIREELYGDANIQGSYPEIHRRMVEVIGECASESRPVVIDATHYRSSYRKEALALLQRFGYNDVTLVVVIKPLEVCLRRNASRDRRVPKKVIKNMHRSLTASLAHVESEGFTRIQYVY